MTSLAIHAAPGGQPLTIRYRAPETLIPDPRNARTHPPRQIAQIAASIRAFGFANPILVDETGTLIAGHGRLLAAKALALAAVPTIALAGLAPAQKRALRLADNRIAQNAGWDAAILRQELAALATIDVDVDVALTGFAAGEIEIILDGSRSAGKQRTAAEDRIPAAVSVANTRLGDVWCLGEHRIGCGGIGDRAFVQRVIGKDRIDAAFLDPFDPAAIGDADPDGAAFRAWLSDALALCAGLSRDGAVHFICADWRRIDAIAALAVPVYGAPIDLCVWTGGQAGTGALYRPQHELVFVHRVGTSPVGDADAPRRRGNVWDHRPVDAGRRGRRAEAAAQRAVKPVALVADAIGDVTQAGDLVLDIFAGTGTSLIAADRAGCRFRGIDSDPGRIDRIIARWCALTGGSAERLGEAA